MTIYRTNGPWGLGKGASLTSVEGDENLYDIVQRLVALETATAPVVGISNIEAVGSQMMIYLTNGDSFGPFTLPTAMFRFRGEWAEDAIYAALDLVTVAQQGMFLVNIAHEAVAPFDPARVTDDGDSYYTKVFGESTYLYDVGFYFPGHPGQGIPVDGNMLEHLFVRASRLPADLLASIAKLDANATADLTMVIKKNADAIGTMVFAAGTRVGVLALDDDESVDFAIGDILGIQRPDDIDVTATGLAVTFAANVI